MRIIAGEHKKRKLFSPRMKFLRPTSDRFRENIFNILSGYFENAKVLDLFAGVGTLGLEALSRGAKEVTFVDDSVQALSYLRKNTEFCRNQVHIIPAKVETAIKALCKKKHVILSPKPLVAQGEGSLPGFDVIFVDPPYEEDLVNETLEMLDKFPVMASGCVIVVQHSRREEIKGAPTMSSQRKRGSISDSQWIPAFAGMTCEVKNAWKNFSIFDIRKYGDTHITFLCHSRPIKDVIPRTEGPRDLKGDSSHFVLGMTNGTNDE